LISPDIAPIPEQLSVIFIYEASLQRKFDGSPLPSAKSPVRRVRRARTGCFAFAETHLSCRGSGLAIAGSHCPLILACLAGVQ
jgi:hypothetical protein